LSTYKTNIIQKVELYGNLWNFSCITGNTSITARAELVLNPK